MSRLVPMVAEKDLSDLTTEDSTLNEGERERLLAIGRERAKAGLDRLVAAVGDAYAESLSPEEMRTLIEQNASPARQHWLAVAPLAIQQAMTTLGGLDLKKETAAEFCAQTGKMCDRE